jgi:hypothetical protein
MTSDIVRELIYNGIVISVLSSLPLAIVLLVFKIVKMIK